MSKRIPTYSIERKKARWGWIFVAPTLIFFSVFSFYPIFNALYTSLFKKKLLSLKPPDFIELDNYSYLLKSPDFWNSMRATVVFTLGTFVPLLIFSLIFAIFIMSRKRFQNFFQIAYYSPAVLSSVVAAVIWLLIFDPRGLGNNQWLNLIMNTPGIDHKWLANSVMVQMSTMMVYFWKDEILDAARIDGASELMIFRTIILPNSIPAVATLAILTFKAQWDNLLWPLLVVQSEDMKTIPLYIVKFMAEKHTDEGAMMAVAAIASIPILIVFFKLSKYFLGGAALYSSRKG